MKTLLQTLAVVTILILAGCQGTPTQSTPEPTTSNVATTSYTATTTTTSDTPTSSSFKAQVSFPSCTQATINAESYSWVGFILENGSTTREGNYTDTQEFETDSVIQSVIIVSETGEVEVSNPGYEQCTAPPTTTTEATAVETTVRTTTAPTTTPTATTTTQTPTTTTTTTVQTTTRPPLEESKISTHIENETLGRNATAVHVVTNYHDTTVRFHYDVGFYDHRNGGSDFMESVDRTTLVLEPGESARVVAEYDGNVTIDDIRYQINGLRYA